MSSIIIPTLDPRDIMSSLSTSSIVEVGGRDGEVRPADSFLPLFPFCVSSEGYFKGAQIVHHFGQVVGLCNLSHDYQCLLSK